jgi:hypothetical protein
MKKQKKQETGKKKRREEKASTDYTDYRITQMGTGEGKRQRFRGKTQGTKPTARLRGVKAHPGCRVPRRSI